MATDNKRPEVIANIWKARKSWSRMYWILGWEDVDTRTLRNFYIAVVQSILLFGSDTWVVTPHIKRILGGFHHIVAQLVLRKIHWRSTEGT